MFISWQDLEGALPDLPGFVSGAIGAARGFACGLGRNYEDYFVGPSALDPLGTVRRGIVDKICGVPPSNPPGPYPPYDGSTCACSPFRITYDIYDGDTKLASNLQLVRSGPFFGVSSRKTGETSIAWFLKYGNCSNGQLVGVKEDPLPSGNDKIRVAVTNVQQEGAPPSTCVVPRPPGNQPPTPPPPERQREFPSIQISPTVSVPVSITLVKPTVNINPTVDIEVNVGPVNINFGLGGVTIDLAPNLPPSPPGTPQPLPPLPPGQPPRPPALPPGGEGTVCPDPCPEIDLTEINSKLDGLKELAEDIKECACEPEYNYGQQVLSNSDGAIIELPEGSYIVRVVINQIPSSAKVEFGRNSAPNVYYAGWYTFGGAGFLADREPISYQQNAYDVPQGANTFSFTLRSGYTATVTALIRTKKEEET